VRRLSFSPFPPTTPLLAAFFSFAVTLLDKGFLTKARDLAEEKNDCRLPMTSFLLFFLFFLPQCRPLQCTYESNPPFLSHEEEWKVISLLLRAFPFFPEASSLFSNSYRKASASFPLGGDSEKRKTFSSLFSFLLSPEYSFPFFSPCLSKKRARISLPLTVKTPSHPLRTDPLTPDRMK